MIDEPDFLAVHEEDPMSLHLIFIEFQSINWDDFIEELRVSLEPLVKSQSMKTNVQS